MSEPSNQELYDKVQKRLYAKYPKHSAYRSGLLVQEYKSRGGTYVGSKNKSSGLNRWFREKWVNSRGEEGYKINLMFTDQLLELIKIRQLHLRN